MSLENIFTGKKSGYFIQGSVQEVGYYTHLPDYKQINGAVQRL